MPQSRIKPIRAGQRPTQPRRGGPRKASQQCLQLRRSGHQYLRPPLRQPAGHGGLIDGRRGGQSFHKNAGRPQSLAQKVRYAIRALRPRQEHGQTVAFLHQLAQAHTKKIPGAVQITRRKSQTLGRARGARGFQADHALHVTLRHAAKMPPVAQMTGRGEGQTDQILQSFHFQITTGQMPGIK